jgi:hypothetical protein
MASGRTPGNEIDPALPLPVRLHTAEIASRGRIYFPPWLITNLDWLKADVRVLVVFDEPGLIRLLPWSPNGEAVVARRGELADSGDLEAIALLQDRYRAVTIPSDFRPIFGDSAIVHLGLMELNRPHVYLSRVDNQFRIMSPRFRNRELARIRSAFASLP